MIKHFLVAILFIAPIALAAQKSFADLKGCLPLPVHHYEPLSSIKKENDNHENTSICCLGCDVFSLNCNPHEKVFSCFKGEVISVFKVEDNYGLIVKYASENYSMTYGNLKTVNFKKGDVVNEGSFIGIVGCDMSYTSSCQLVLLLMKDLKYLPTKEWFSFGKSNE